MGCWPRGSGSGAARPAERGRHFGTVPATRACSQRLEPVPPTSWIPCNRGFIGDYFGLAISSGNVYAFFISTHYPSGVTADGGGKVYYQQQVLSTISQAALGI